MASIIPNPAIVQHRHFALTGGTGDFAASGKSIYPEVVRADELKAFLRRRAAKLGLPVRYALAAEPGRFVDGHAAVAFRPMPPVPKCPPPPPIPPQQHGFDRAAIKAICDAAQAEWRKAGPRTRKVKFRFRGKTYVSSLTAFRMVIDDMQGRPVACRYHS